MATGRRSKNSRLAWLPHRRLLGDLSNYHSRDDPGIRLSEERPQRRFTRHVEPGLSRRWRSSFTMIRNFPKRLTRLQKRLMLGKRPMLGQGNRRARSRRLGAATIEMAFIAPVIFAIVFGSVEFARVMMVRQSLTNAAREGCRHACLGENANHSQQPKARPSVLTYATPRRGSTR